MPLATKIEKFIQSQAIQCQSVHHPRSRDLPHAVVLAQAVPELTLRARLILDRQGPALFIHGFTAIPDIEAINEHSGREYQVIDDQQAGKLFKDCDTGHIPFMAQAYGLPVFVDESVYELDQAFVSSGCANTLLRLPKISLRAALHGATKGQFAKNLAPVEPEFEVNRDYTLDEVARRLEKLYRLPPMPETAVRVMHLISDPDSHVENLAELIERDPSMSAQIMRYARSALFNYRGELTSVKDAVNIVLGFDRVSKLAMGIAAAKAFSIPDSGPLGMDRFWQHAFFCAVLSQALAVMAEPELKLDDKDAYLAGLLHNFGILLIGHLFPPEFSMLNKLREAEPVLSMQELESQVFGMGSAQQFISLGHGSMGAILLKLWGLPESSIKAAAMHQKIGYQGEKAEYVQIVQLANHLLALHGIGDEPPLEDAKGLLDALGISEDKALQLAELTVTQCNVPSQVDGSMVA